MARLSDGSWSAPCAIVASGLGFGGQLGLELTDFVFILNDQNAVRTFSQNGITLGGNVSIAAGPVGRNAEAAGAASLKGVAAVFSYSKTKGLFAGVSIEGSVLVQRDEANQKVYGSRIKALELLEGSVRPPPAAEPLMRVLSSRIFSGGPSGGQEGDMYNDVPVYDDRHDDVIWEGRRTGAYGEGVQRDRTGSSADNQREFREKPRRSTWADDLYDRSSNNVGAANRSSTFMNGGSNRAKSGFGDDYVYSDTKPSRPTAPKPSFREKPTAAELGRNRAVALYNFDADQPGDLGFRKGEIITITKRTDSKNDWWTGRIGEKEGIFPRWAELKMMI